MMLTAIVAAEIAFWACLVLGCLLRYAFKMPKLGLIFLAATPLIDLLLLVFFYVTLGEDGEAQFMHGFAAFYISFSVVFGKDIIQFVDAKISGDTNRKPVDDEKRSFRKCIIACAGTALLLGIGILVTGLSGSFWLVYWLIAVAFTPVMWWVAARLTKKKANG